MKRARRRNAGENFGKKYGEARSKAFNARALIEGARARKKKRRKAAQKARRRNR